MRAGEEQAVDFLRQQRGAHFATANQRHEHLLGHARRMQQARNRQAGHGGVFGRLVEHRIAGQQRRDKHVAAHKPRVVPGRNVRHHAQRQVLDLFSHPAVAENGLRGSRCLNLVQEKVNAAQQAIEFIARHADGFAGFTRHDERQWLQFIDDGGAKACHASHAFGQRSSRPGGLGGTRLPRLGGHRCVVVGRQFGDQRTGGGVVNSHPFHAAAREFLDAATAPKKSFSTAPSSIVSEPGWWNSGCHCSAAM